MQKADTTVEFTKVARTVTEADHEAGKFLKVAVGDIIVEVVQKTVAVIEDVIRYELNGESYVDEEVVAEEKPKTKKAK
jgi:hypothetical protein